MPRTVVDMNLVFISSFRIQLIYFIEQKDSRNKNFSQMHQCLCGEYNLGLSRRTKEIETPPLARRKHHHDARGAGLLGNTSACAEKTLTRKRRSIVVKKHLRLRGENSTSGGKTK